MLALGLAFLLANEKNSELLETLQHGLIVILCWITTYFSW